MTDERSPMIVDPSKAVAPRLIETCLRQRVADGRADAIDLALLAVEDPKFAAWMHSMTEMRLRMENR